MTIFLDILYACFIAIFALMCYKLGYNEGERVGYQRSRSLHPSARGKR